MEFYELLDIVQNVKPANIRLFLIIRELKEGVKKSSPMLDRYQFKAYQIDIDSEIRDHFHTITTGIIGKQVSDEVELREYDVITDDAEQAFTYSIKNKALSFSDIVLNQLKGNVPKIKNLQEIFTQGDLWAYCTSLSLHPDDHLYTFRKYSINRVAVDAGENPEAGMLKKFFQTHFNTESKKLELIHGQTMNLDKSIDCIYYRDVFYVIRKTQFEHIVGIAEEFKETSINFVDELEATNKFDGLDLLRAQIESKPTLHRKLSRLARLKNHVSIDSSTLANMQHAAKLENKQVNIKNGKLAIENEMDIELVIKMLSEFYKTGMVFGKKYGTYAGRELGNS